MWAAWRPAVGTPSDQIVMHLQGGRPADRGGERRTVDALGSELFVFPVKDNSAMTLRPEAGGVLGELLPVALPVTVPKFFFGTTMASITDSNGRMPPTAGIDPVASSLAPRRQTDPLTPSAGDYPPGVDPTDPPTVCGASFRANVSFVFYSSPTSSTPLQTVTGMWHVGVEGGTDEAGPSRQLVALATSLSDVVSLTRAGDAGRREVAGKVSLLVIPSPAFVKDAGTMRPVVVGTLGVLLPAALPVTVSTLPFGTRDALVAGSKTRIPGTAVMDPVAGSRVQGHLTATTRPSIGPFTPTGVETEPPVGEDMFGVAGDAFAILCHGYALFPWGGCSCLIHFAM